MAEYIYIEDYLKKGNLGISKNVFYFLAKQTINRIPGISPSKKYSKKDIFRLNKPLEISIKHGIVHVSVQVDVVKGTNIQEISKIISDEINNVFLISTEHVPFDVQVKVISII